MNPIPFNRPCVLEAGFDYLREAIARGHLSGDGHFTKKCHALLEEKLGVPRVQLTTSCTHALEMAALLLDIQPGDEVIVPSFTFVSTVNAFVLRGAKPIFCDIRPDTLNLDESRLQWLITPKTRAIVPVHYAGVGCEMDEIAEIASQHRLAVIEDNAHGLFGRYRGRMLGSLGGMATQSFHETKNFSCGEGGALLLNDLQFAERAEIIREKGTNRNQFFRGEVDKYTWVDVGSSYLPSDALAALLFAQLEKGQAIQTRRHEVWNRYDRRLIDWARSHAVRTPEVPLYCDHPAHMYYLIFPSLRERQAFIAHMKSQGILCVFHYSPLHLSPMGRRFGGKGGDCPITEAVSNRLVRLPFFHDLTAADQDRVIDAIHSFRVGTTRARAQDPLHLPQAA
jgi:dTDP-4-amino-4,6-dideoxygalactose transaminase